MAQTGDTAHSPEWDHICQPACDGWIRPIPRAITHSQVTGLKKRRTAEGFRCFAQAADFRSRDPKDVSVLVVGPTGYIGKFVAKELIARGYKVVVFAREKSGVGGKASKEQTIKVCVQGFWHY